MKKKAVTKKEMIRVLSDFIKMKFGVINDFVSKRDFKGLREIFKTEELNKFDTIDEIYGMGDENGIDLILSFDASKEFGGYVVYTLNIKTLEVDILLIEDDYKKAGRFFYGFKYSDKYFEIEDNLGENESLMSCNEDGVWVHYINKYVNNEVVSTTELNEHRLKEGLKPIEFNPIADLYKRT